MSSASRSMRRACWTTASPAAVSATRRGRRSTSGTPSDSSSFFSCAERVGWETWQRAAARPKWRVSASATRYSRSRSVIGIVYHNIVTIDYTNETAGRILCPS